MDELQATRPRPGRGNLRTSHLPLLWFAVAALATSCAPVQATTPAPTFELVNQHGQPTRLDALRGRTVLLTFLYTSCPDTCPLYLSNLAASVHTIEERGDEAPAVVVVTVDPDRDTVERLRAFAAPWPRDWIFMTGSYQQVAEVWRSYDVAVEKRPLEGSSEVHVHQGYAVLHSAKLLVIDPSGSFRATLTGTWTAPELTAVLATSRASDGGLAGLSVPGSLADLLRRCGQLAAAQPGLFAGLIALVAGGALLLPTVLLRTFLRTRAPPRSRALMTGALVRDHAGPSNHDLAR